MKSKTSFYNQGILRSDFRRLWWIPSLMTLIMFLDKPLSLLNDLEYYMQSTFPPNIDLYQNIPMIHYCYPVLAAALLFRYLHTQKATQFFHTLPVTRGQLLRTKLISLWIFAVVPVLINWAAVAVIYCTTPMSHYLKLTQVNAFYGGILCAHLALCGVSVFAASITGNTAGMIAASIGLPFLPSILITMLQYGLEAVLKGFAGFPSGAEIFCYNLIPNPTDLNWQTAWFTLSEFILFTLLGALLYRSYATERTGDLITVKWMRPVFLFGVTFCATMTGLAYTQSNYYEAAGTLFVSAIATVLGFYAAEALLKRTLRVWSSWKKLVSYAVAAVIILGFIKLDPIGYQTRVPKTEDIAAVAYGSFSAPPTTQEEIDKYYYTSCGLFSEPENIEMITQLHNRAIHQKGNGARYMNKSYITYLLKDGSQVKRAYYFYPDQDQDLLNTKEYRISSNPIFRIPENNILAADIYTLEYEEDTSVKGTETSSIQNSNDLKQLIAAMKQDLLEQDIFGSESYSIALQLKGEPYETRVSITDGTHTKEFLKEYHSR